MADVLPSAQYRKTKKRDALAIMQALYSPQYSLKPLNSGLNARQTVSNNDSHIQDEI